MLAKNYYSVADNMWFICAPVNYSYSLSYEHCLAFILLMKPRVIICRYYVSFIKAGMTAV